MELRGLKPSNNRFLSRRCYSIGGPLRSLCLSSAKRRQIEQSFVHGFESLSFLKNWCNSTPRWNRHTLESSILLGHRPYFFIVHLLSITNWAVQKSRDWFVLELPNFTRTSMPTYPMATPAGYDVISYFRSAVIEVQKTAENAATNGFEANFSSVAFCLPHHLVGFLFSLVCQRFSCCFLCEHGRRVVQHC